MRSSAGGRAADGFPAGDHGTHPKAARRALLHSGEALRPLRQAVEEAAGTPHDPALVRRVHSMEGCRMPVSEKSEWRFYWWMMVLGVLGGYKALGNVQAAFGVGILVLLMSALVVVLLDVLLEKHGVRG